MIPKNCKQEKKIPRRAGADFYKTYEKTKGKPTAKKKGLVYPQRAMLSNFMLREEIEKESRKGKWGVGVVMSWISDVW